MEGNYKKRKKDIYNSERWKLYFKERKWEKKGKEKIKIEEKRRKRRENKALEEREKKNSG